MEKEKITVFMLIPTLQTTVAANVVFEFIIHMFGTLNIKEGPEHVCAIKINIPVTNEHQDKVLTLCKKYGYTGLFITAPEFCDNIFENSIVL